MENTVFVDLFLLVVFMLYLVHSWFWNKKNHAVISKFKRDPSYIEIVRATRIIWILVLLVICIWLGLMCWLLINCLTAWHAAGTSSYLLVVLFAVLSLWQIGLAQFCKLILLYAKNANIQLE